MWEDNEVHGAHGEAIKRIRHPLLGPIAFEYSTFAVDGRTDLSLVVYNPATAHDAERIGSLLEEVRLDKPPAPPRPARSAESVSSPQRRAMGRRRA